MNRLPFAVVLIWVIGCGDGPNETKADPVDIAWVIANTKKAHERADLLAAELEGLAAELEAERDVNGSLMDQIIALEAAQAPATLSAAVAASKPRKGRYDPDNVWKRTRAQGALLARMFVSEASSALWRKPRGTEGELTLDHRLIMQTIYNHRQSRQSFKGWIDVMAFLSPHVGQIKDPVDGTRQRWTSGLKADGDGPPDAWIDARSPHTGKPDGDWRVHGPFWVALREETIDVWMNTDFAVIDSYMKKKPRKWGNEQDVIRTLEKYPDNWCVLDTDTSNFFMARPGEGCELNDPATVAARTGKHLRDGP